MLADVPPEKVIEHRIERRSCGCSIEFERYNFGYSKTLKKDNRGWAENITPCKEHGRLDTVYFIK
jgi:hypothetical protein